MCYLLFPLVAQTLHFDNSNVRVESSSDNKMWLECERESENDAGLLVGIQCRVDSGLNVSDFDPYAISYVNVDFKPLTL